MLARSTIWVNACEVTPCSRMTSSASSRVRGTPSPRSTPFFSQEPSPRSLGLTSNSDLNVAWFAAWRERSPACFTLGNWASTSAGRGRDRI